MGILFELEQKMIRQGIVTLPELKKFENRGSHAYRVYTIPKRKAGHRVIAHPSAKLKLCQKELISLLEMQLPVHNAAYAYVKGKGIKDNALVHVKSDYLLKMDFHNFFNSITPSILESHFEKNGVFLKESEKAGLRQFIFWNPSKKRNGKLILSVGSPASPFISNTIMYDFDRVVSDFCELNKINYTRYADDLTFSTNKKGILFSVPEIVKRMLASGFNGKIVVNDAKTIFSSKAHNRHVTGITLNNQGKLSLGRKRKRYVSSLIFKYINDELDNEEIQYLVGLISFCHSVEPMFIDRLSKKYEVNIRQEILHRGYRVE